VNVQCPNCQVKLKIDEKTRKARGAMFKCPRCSTAFLVIESPSALPRKLLDQRKILVAHSNPGTINEITSLLTRKGYQTVTSPDGIDAIVKAIKEVPFLAIVELELPKIYGFEVCRRIKSKAKTKEMRFLFVISAYSKRHREIPSLCAAEDFIEDKRISEVLIEKISALKGIRKELKTEQPVITTLEEKIEKAKMLAKTILSDLYHYNPSKVEESIKNNNFYTVFEPELKEGLKLYESRIPPEVRERGDFFKEAVEDFIRNRKKLYNL